MIDQKIIDAYKKCQGTGIRESRTLQTEWVILFNYYNSHIPIGGKRLGMACAPCFVKVLSFAGDKIREAASAGSPQ